MADSLPLAPTLPQQFGAFKDQASDSAAYEQEMTRLRQTAQPAGQADKAEPAGAQTAPAAAGASPEAGSPLPASAPAPAAASGAGQEPAIKAEVDRLRQPPFDPARHDDPETALRTRAMGNLGMQAEAAAVDPNAKPGGADAGLKVAKDVAYGSIVELPRAVWGGIHDAVKGVIKMGDTLDSSVAHWFDSHSLEALNAAVGHDKSGFHLLSGAEAEAMKSAGSAHEVQLSQHVPGQFDDPTTVTGNLIKGAAQFVTGMVFAGNQFRALGLPTNLNGWAGRGVTAAQGMLAMFETTDGAQHRLSDLIQAVPKLRNPVTEALSSHPDDSEWTGRIKSALEGTVLAQAGDAVVGGLRMLRGSMIAKAGAEEAITADQARPPPPPSAGMQAMGDTNADAGSPLTEIVAKPTATELKLRSAAASSAGKTPEEVAAMGEPASQQTSYPSIKPGEKLGPYVAGEYVPDADTIDSWTSNGRTVEPGIQKVPVADLVENRSANQNWMSDGYKEQWNEHVSDLTDQIKTSGQMNPLIVSLDDKGNPQILEGAHRLDAARELGATHVPAIVVRESGVPIRSSRSSDIAGPASPGATEAQAKEPGVYINFNRFDTTDDLKRSISELATAYKDDIDTARRGVQTFEQTKLGANAKDAWATLMDRRQGDPLNDQESLAVRQLWASSAAKTMETARIATEAPTPENLFAFRKMLSTHAAIQQEVISARTETARALSSWRIPAGEDSQRLESMMNQLAANGDLRGGMETALDLAQRVKALESTGDVEHLDELVSKSAGAKTRDAVLETWTNMLLTNPLTHVKVTVSNAATVALRMVERATASKISNVLGDQDGVAAGEAAAQYAGLMGGLKDSFRYIGKAANGLVSGEGLPPLGDDPLSNAVKSFKSGAYTLDREAGSEYLQNQGAVSSQALEISNSGWLGQAIDYAGQLIRTPGRALTGEHDFFRSLGYRMELHALATRQAVSDVNAGRITEDALGNRVAELVANPPPDLNVGAVNGTLYQTFTDAPGKLGELVGELRNAFPAARVILPFYKIPSRIMAFSLERSPMAPLMSTFRANMAAGGARQSIAMAQMGLGTSMMLATADAVLSGSMTGAGPTEHGVRAAMENEGWQPYSVKSGDRWVQYNRIETVGSSMAMAADAVEAIRNFHTGINGDDPDVSNLAVATAFAVANDITSKSYLQGLSNFFEAMGSPATGANRLLTGLAGSTVPAGLAAVDRLTDPYKRAVYGMMDAIKSRTPGVSEGMPPVRNLWGESVKNDSGMGKMYDAFVPATSRDPANEPIDKELIRQDINISKLPTRTSFEGTTVDLRDQPKIYSRLQELAGNGYKDPGTGLGLKDSLNALVTGQHPLSPVYDMFGKNGDGPDGHKADMIKDMVREFREGAKQQLLEEYPHLQTQVSEKQQAKMALKMPGIQ